MTTEFVLILGLYAFILGGVFFNKDKGPLQTFKSSGPRLGAVIERDISVGRKFKSGKGGAPLEWQDPDKKGI